MDICVLDLTDWDETYIVDPNVDLASMITVYITIDY